MTNCINTQLRNRDFVTVITSAYFASVILISMGLGALESIVNISAKGTSHLAVCVALLAWVPCSMLLLTKRLFEWHRTPWFKAVVGIGAAPAGILQSTTTDMIIGLIRVSGNSLAEPASHQTCLACCAMAVLNVVVVDTLSSVLLNLFSEKHN